MPAKPAPEMDARGPFAYLGCLSLAASTVAVVAFALAVLS